MATTLMRLALNLLFMANSELLCDRFYAADVSQLHAVHAVHAVHAAPEQLDLYYELHLYIRSNIES